MKKILMWLLVIFMAMTVLVYFPSITSVIALVFVVITLPIKPLQDFWAAHKLQGKAKVVLLCVIFLATALTAPKQETPDTRTVDNSSAVSSADPAPSEDAVQAQTPEPTPTPTPDPTPEPTPIPTPDPTPDPTLAPEPTPALQPIRGRDPDTIVYVSSRSHTIHSVHNCSGMKNYTEMTIYQANSKGYKFCPNCW